MKPISNVYNMDEFAGRIVAYDDPSHSCSFNDVPTVGNKAGLKFAVVWRRNWDAFDMSKLINPTAVHSSIPVTDKRLSRTTMTMRLATLDELNTIKEMLAMQQAVFDYTDKRKALCIVEDAIAIMVGSESTKEMCFKEVENTRKREALEEEVQAEWIRKISPRIEFKDCQQNESEQMICSVQDEPFVERIVTRVGRHFIEPWEKIDHDVYLECDEIIPGKSCDGEKTRYTVRHKSSEPPTLPSIFATVGTAALYSASYVALSEAVGDTLYLTGLISQTNAEQVKKASQLMLVYLSGSMLSSAASWTTTRLLEKTGYVSKQNAQLAGQAVAIGMNLGTRIFTSTGLAVTAAGIAGGHFGLWAEKKVIATLSAHNTEESLTP